MICPLPVVPCQQIVDYAILLINHSTVVLERWLGENKDPLFSFLRLLSLGKLQIFVESIAL
jgi:hypothetical protein